MPALLPLVLATFACPVAAQETPPAVVPAARDAFRITLPKEAAEAFELPEGSAGTGRMILFFLGGSSHQSRRFRGADPMDAPFYAHPQPVASVEVPVLQAGSTITIDGRSLAWPVSVDELNGPFRIQAVYRRNREARGHRAPGNLCTAVMEVDLASDAVDEFDLVLDRKIPEEPLPERPNLKWMSIKSELLSAFYGRDIHLNAGIAFPPDYDKLDAKRRVWPVVYVVPGFGGNHLDATHWADMLMTPGISAIAPQAVYVVLDPECPLGHHGFCDSDNNGPRGEALVKELIPAIESRFRVVAKPEARIVTGHSSGGWASLWLQLRYPDVFGACFSSAPDPVDFSAFQAGDLYHDPNLYVDAEGHEQPSFRQPLGPSEDRVMMTVREEMGVEHVLGPRGDSGEQWGTWAAMFSRRDPQARMPKRFVDPVSGAVDHAVVEEDWSRYDIGRMVEGDWQRYGPILEGKVRLVCGERDSYYLNRAVERLREAVERLKQADVAANREPPSGPGYIEIVPRATHETIIGLTTMRWNQEMMEYFRAAGLGD